MLFILGGEQRSASCPAENSADKFECVLAGELDVWQFDSPARGWEKVTFQRSYWNVTAANEDCSQAKIYINKDLPANRAGHTAVSTGNQSLVCGGYNHTAEKVNNMQTLTNVLSTSDNGVGMECWWLTPTPYPRFEHVHACVQQCVMDDNYRDIPSNGVSR